MHTASDSQTQILDDLVTGLSVAQISARHGISRQRCQAQITSLRNKGILSTELPAGASYKELHPQESRTHPWPPPGRYIQLFPNTDDKLIIRSVLLPRADGTELPAGLPDTYAVVLNRPEHPGSVAWEVSRRERWALTHTMDVYLEWVTRRSTWLEWEPVTAYPLRPVPPTIEMDIDRCHALTLAIAWVARTEAILYSTPRRA